MTDPVSVAQHVLAAEAAPGPTLSLAPGMPPVTIDTPVADARRNYMRLAALIHPDKLKGSLEKSTEAFQLLVRAFETFVNPVARKKAFAAQAKAKTTLQKSAKAAQAKPSKKKPRSEVAVKKPRRKAASESEDDEVVTSESEAFDEEASDSDDEEKEFHFSDDDNGEPLVSNSRTPIGKLRSGADYVMTIIGCPNCRSRWEPDTRQQYSLFMGQWGKKVHCQLCLLVFGSATALHNCPHCQSSFDYDASMYDSVMNCRRCKHRIGFPYYPVSQHLIDQVTLDEWRARKEAERAEVRERRHRARQGGDDPQAAAQAQMQLWVGTCVVEEECPLCHARVSRHHKQHVEVCAQAHRPTAAGAAAESTVAADKTAKPRTGRAAGPKAAPATRKTEKKPPVSKKTDTAVAPTKKPAAPSPKASTAGRKKEPVGKKAKRRGSSSDEDDDDDEDESFSDDESDASESSFDEDDALSSDDD